MKTVSVDNMAAAISSTLLEYTEDVAAEVKAEAKDCADELAEDIRNDARAKFKGNKYYKGWAVKKAFESPSDVRYTVYNKTNWQLTHLLEYGHEKWLWGKKTGGRVEGKAHIRPNADRIIEKFSRACERIVKGK